MKKRNVLIVVILVVVFALLWKSCGGLGFVSLNKNAKATITFDYTYYEYGPRDENGKRPEPTLRRVTFTEELTEEETAAIIEILDGKVSYYSPMPSCGFNDDIAIIIGGVKFAIGCDGCGSIQNRNNLQFIDISNEERDIIDEMFTSRGATFPCI